MRNERKLRKVVDVMSLGLLLFGGTLLCSAVKCGLENIDMMSKPHHHLDDGTPVYLDRKCQEWANGEKIMPVYDYKNQKLVYAGQRSGKVYVDPEEIKRKRMLAWDEEDKQLQISWGKAAYLKYEPRHNRRLTCEISTGKYIAKLVGKPRCGWKRDGLDYEGYRKFYLDLNANSAMNSMPGDQGIPITMEEFDKLNIVCGSHFAFDGYRDGTGRLPDDPFYNNRTLYIGGHI